ncbi:hypothetical protein A1O1_08154 [Capronia coronata CBS 617.96]|uniref:FAM192A/Fyv6 N-terminal domain-containing protein n=1 Tax=Capronia coronata CBS 617.96 TaxID=1182541 RepID=W9XXJ4_9EURO|nr:uncharacterized protein A1O1_08154 [Capronia coronata CBS 617.96]EXJ82085.1 hypothetical protein A1O1_08154 [Capronia coronata CBS 617.96]
MSKFVSAGTDADSRPPPDAAWLKAQQEVEARRKSKVAEDGSQDGGKSLYEVLQQNKAAKQEAFEESIRLKNQFRPLDEDEVDFLDSVLESKRAEEDAVKQQTAEQLEAFRKQRALAEQALLDQHATDEATKADVPVGKNVWTTQKKKRRRDKKDEGEGEFEVNPKARKLSPLTADSKVSDTDQPDSTSSEHQNAGPEAKVSPDRPQTGPPKATPIALGLGDYSSDDDD